jgi:ribosomal protein S18 acetylase RimI-like enzyme
VISPESIELVRPDTPELWGAARRLVEEYVAGLNLDLSFQDVQQEIDSLAQEYGPPEGCFLLARSHGVFVGCGGVRRFGEAECEMKRLYVVPTRQGQRIGRAIAESLITYSRDAGYESMLLDTLPSMTSAYHLYLALGFTPTAPYRHNPIPGATFWRLPLGGVRFE